MSLPIERNRSHRAAAAAAPAASSRSRNYLSSYDSAPVAYAATKRVLDVCVAVLFLVIAAPVFIFIAIVIKREDGGPIFYGQERVGRNGETFRFWKFRSMVVNADALKATLATANEASGPIFKMKDDPRITRAGRVLRRYSLDELPQFWNVLRGEMSLVGPRPHLPREIAECGKNYPAARLTVPPGLLCYREVSGRSKMTFEEWIALDMAYVRSRSLRVDLSILLRAVPAVLKGDGAY